MCEDNGIMNYKTYICIYTFQLINKTQNDNGFVYQP